MIKDTPCCLIINCSDLLFKQILHLSLSVFQIAEVGKDSLPAWLHWDASSRILQGLPLDEDKGVHYISVSTSNRTKSFSAPEVFSIEVHPEDHFDTESSQLASNQASTGDDVQPFTCSNEEPVTVLTVILDADLTKMSSKQRVDLLDNMQSFSGVGLQYMRVLPVVNNRLFDMSAFMAGPGNAKKVSEIRQQFDMQCIIRWIIFDLSLSM